MLFFENIAKDILQKVFITSQLNVTRYSYNTGLKVCNGNICILACIHYTKLKCNRPRKQNCTHGFRMHINVASAVLTLAFIVYK